MKINILRVTFIFFLLLLAPEMFAQDTWQEEAEADIVLNIFTQTSVRTITVGMPWTLFIYVNHSIPDEVTVVTPQFAPSLILDRIAKTPRMIGMNLQTVLEYRFMPDSPGRFFIEPFTVITPHGRADTERYILDVRGLTAEQRVFAPGIVWEDVPRQMAAGARAAIALRITGWDSNSLPPDFFMPEIPRGAILVSLPLQAEDMARGIVLKFNLVPLEAGSFILPSRTLRYENAVFNIPALSINVTNSAGRALPQSNEQSGPLIDETSASDDIQFPGFTLSAFDKNISESRQSQCEIIYKKSKDLWDNGLRAQALAELRRNERNHPAGDLLRSVRQEAEKKLMFINTRNEERASQKILLIFTISFLILVIISIFNCFFLKRGIFVKKISLVCAVIFTAAGSFCFYRYMDSSALFSGNRFGVTKETSVRRTADIEGGELFRFREGQPVVILLNSGVWVYVRANDAEGKSGWISSEEVIFY